MSLLLSLLLIVTVSIIVVLKYLYKNSIFSDQVQIVLGRYAFVILMILITTSVIQVWHKTR
jgi:membrane protein